MIRRKWSAREILLGAAFLLATVGLLTFYVWYQTEAVQLGFETSKRQESIKFLKEEIGKLELLKTALASPERIEKRAREALGLVDSKPEDIFYSDHDQ
jgi:cell division protein FtsL